MFCVSRDDLYSLRVQRDDLDHILRTILRLYTGVFHDFRPVDIQEIAIYTGYTEDRVKELLKMLWQLRIIRYSPKNRSPMIFFLDNRLPVQDIYISPQTYKVRKEMALERLGVMFDYADNGTECRSVLLQRYFGQDDAIPCGVCDVCIEKKKTGRAGAQSVRQKIISILAQGPATVKDIVSGFKADPKDILAELDDLSAEGILITGSDGRVRLK